MQLEEEFEFWGMGEDFFVALLYVLCRHKPGVLIIYYDRELESAFYHFIPS